MDFPDLLDTQLKKVCCIHDEALRSDLVNKLLLIHTTDNLLQQITQMLTDALSNQPPPYAPLYFEKLVLNMQYASLGKTFYDYAREMMCQVIYHNIYKANHIQTNIYLIPDHEIKNHFSQLDMNVILCKQNCMSANATTGNIGVLSTAVLFVPEYNFDLLNAPPLS